jgi:hypothetical protein
MTRVGVVYLARAAHGEEMFRRFLQSYQTHRGGIEHDLLIVFKGFQSKEELAPYLALLQEETYQSLEVEDVGFDIAPYFRAADSFAWDYFCFLNSTSVVLDADWLAKLVGLVSAPGIGLAGATGSWGSLYSAWLRQVQGPTGEPVAWYRRLWRRTLLRYLVWRRFPPFPNPHIRTTAFVIGRRLFRELSRPIRTKTDAHKFESGWHGLTRQVRRRGLRSLVVGRDGRGYEEQQWFASNTLYQGDQGNLLVADRRTEEYLAADSATRQFLARFAWGERAFAVDPHHPQHSGGAPGQLVRTPPDT